MSKWKVRSIEKRYGGGGGGPAPAPVTTSNIDPEFKPGLLAAQAAAKKEYESGNLGRVAGASGLQEEAYTGGIGRLRESTDLNNASLMEQRGRLTDMANTGGSKELQDALKLDVGMGGAKLGADYGASGTLGSYRHNLASATAEDATKAKFAQNVISNKAAADAALTGNISGTSANATNFLKNLQSTGGEQRTIAQQLADKDYQALSRYASTVYGNPARQQTVVPAASGGGK